MTSDERINSHRWLVSYYRFVIPAEQQQNPLTDSHYS